jgi:hypothetical protein
LLRCYRIVQKAVHQYGTITASALRLHFSNGQGFYTPMALYKRLVKDSCPGHKRTCCPAMYSVTKVDLLYEAQARTPSSMGEDLVAAESGRGSSVHLFVTRPGKKRRFENRAMLEEQCKMRLQNRIFHGQAVKAGQMPWIAMLQYEGYTI